MKNLKTTLCLVLLATYSLSFGQTQEESSEKPYIEVVGTIEKEIVPDEIYISIRLSERQEGRDKISIEQQEEELKRAIQSLEIDLNNLSLKGLAANYRKVGWSKRDVMARSEYNLKVKDAQTAGQVFDKLEALKIKDANISKVDHSKIEEYKKETRISAIKAAKEKADYLLEAIGEKTGTPIYVQEVSLSEVNAYQQNRPAYNVLASNYYADPSSYKESDELEFEKIIVRSSIYVKFGIQSSAE